MLDINFFDVLFSIIFPIFLIIGIGVIMDRIFIADLPTLSKLSFYVFLPTLIFINIVEADITFSEILNVIIFGVIYNVTIFIVGFGTFSIPYFKKNRTTLTLGTWLSNVGNYGIPLITFTFNAYLDIVSIVIMMQSLFTFTFGIIFIQREKKLKDNLKNLFKIPIIYAIALALLLKGFHVTLIPQISEPLNYLGDALVAIALLTLGMQLSRTKLMKDVVQIGTLTILRLCIGPIISLLILLVVPFGFTQDAKAVLIILAGTPVAVNVMLLSLEYKKNVELASQIVFWTTLLSMVSITVLLLILI